MPHPKRSCQNTTYRWCRERSLNFLHARDLDELEDQDTPSGGARREPGQEAAAGKVGRVVACLFGAHLDDQGDVLGP